MIEQGVINIVLDNISKEETLRLREIIHTLIANGCLNIRNGRAIIHFDNDAVLQQIEIEHIKWRRPKQFINLNSNKEQATRK